jgi:hypothetical protein
VRKLLFYIFRFLRLVVLPILPLSAVRALARLLFSRSWGRFQLACQYPRQVQQTTLLRILQRAAGTEYGRRYNFAAIRSIEEFQKNVPVVSYDDLEPYIQRMMKGEPDILVPGVPPYFARTSGTTGAAKYIPVTPAYLEEFQTARRVWYRQVAQLFPGLVRGTLLTMHSPQVEGRTEGGIPYGSLTIATGMIRVQKRLAEGATARAPDLEEWEEAQKIPMSIFYLSDLDTKYYLLMRFALMTKVALMAAINPSTIILMCRKLTEFAPRLIRDLEQGTLDPDLAIEPEMRRRFEKRMRRDPRMARRVRQSLEKHGRVRPPDLWPRLCGVICWKGGSAPFYLRQFPDWFGNLPVMDYGFLATEGSFSVVLSAEGSEGPLAVTGHFLEFIPEEEREKPQPLVVTADQLEKGKRYYLLVTGSHGLYRYDMNDVVEVTGYYARTPCVTFCHKGGSMISYTGEKVGESHVVRAVGEAAASLGLKLAGFCVTVDLRGEHPRYLLAAECDSPIPAERSVDLLVAFDRQLRLANIEYDGKRKSQRLGPPYLVWTAAGAFERWRKRRLEEGAPDAHLKTPHICRDPEILEFLRVERTVEWPQGAPK